MSKRKTFNVPDAVFRKSSFSHTTQYCVEVANAGDLIGVRDSKNITGPALAFTKGEWTAFVAGVKAGEFD
jgi:hypothetical protein